MKYPKFAILPIAVLSAANIASAVNVTLLASDAANTSSFDSGLNWSDSSAPSPGNDYFVSGKILRTPNNGGDITFLGDSLQFGDNDNAGQLSLKNATGATVTVPLLRLTGDAFVRNNTNDTIVTLAGTIELITAGGANLGAGGRLRSDSNAANTDERDLIVTSIITGAGPLTLEKGRDAADIFLRPSGTNTFSGGTTILTNSSTSAVFAENDNVFGAGNVMISSSSMLDVSNGSTNDYISDNASLQLADNTSFINLNYTGTDTIGSLSFDGGNTIVNSGIWGATGNPLATYTSDQISGSGLLLVSIPEPSTSAGILLSSVLGMAIFIRRRRR